MRIYHHLTLEERYYIINEKQVHSLRSIAKRLKISPSTVSRELRRNVCKDGLYRHGAAHIQAQHRRRNCRKNHLVQSSYYELLGHAKRAIANKKQETGTDPTKDGKK